MKGGMITSFFKPKPKPAPPKLRGCPRKRKQPSSPNKSDDKIPAPPAETVSRKYIDYSDTATKKSLEDAVDYTKYYFEVPNALSQLRRGELVALLEEAGKKDSDQEVAEGEEQEDDCNCNDIDATIVQESV